MLPKSDVFVTLRNDGPSVDERGKLWSMITHGDSTRIASDGDMIRFYSRSSLTSPWDEEKLETKFFTFWMQIRTAEIYLTSNDDNFCIRTPNWVIIVLLERGSHELSNTIGRTSKFITNINWRPKQYKAIAETGPDFESNDVASPIIGPKGLVRIRVQFWVSWGHAPTSLAATKASPSYIPPIGHHLDLDFV